MKGLILSGGKGKRLYPLTYTRAKQLIPVANKPVLVHAIESIRNAGVEEIGIVIGQTGPEIREAIGDGARLGVRVTYIEQPSPDGLAHAVKISQEFLGDDSFVMFLGDNVIEGGISKLIGDFTHSGWNSQIVLKEVKNPSSFGVAKLRPDGSIEQLIEKPKDPPSNLALVGIYMFDASVFKAVNAIQPSARNELEITDAIQWLIDHGYSVMPHVHEGWWIDTGKATDMLEANANLLDELKPSIAPDAHLENSDIDRRVTIEAGAHVVNSIIHGPTIIGEHTIIENAYIGPYTSIYHHVTVQNCEIERCIVLEHAEIMDLDERLDSSLIGRNVSLKRKQRKPRTITMNLADHSSVWLV
ncbi:MAG: glucose-1-phosphate thymidylyltransferase [Anaerolineae bacterium]|nr:glucose-1-phosphate thymidylyltransferase [Anaerolineae bacterium]